MATVGRPKRVDLDIVAARLLRAEGWSCRRIGKALGGVPHSTVRDRVKGVEMSEAAAAELAARCNDGLRAAVDRKRREAAERRRVTRELWSRGFSAAEIAAEVGVGVKVVRGDVNGLPSQREMLLSVAVPSSVHVTKIEEFRRTALRHGRDEAVALFASEARV